MPQVKVATVLEFLAWLATSSNRVPAPVNAHYGALADPLHFVLGVVLPLRKLTLPLRGIRASRAIQRPPPVKWSLHKVLHYQSFEGIAVDLTRSIHRAVFLLVLASGYRSSQLAALKHHPD